MLAHIYKDITSGIPEEHLLEAHLCKTAARAKAFADVFGNGDWAYLAGLWHDLGKYQTAFQDYILSRNGLAAHLEAPDNTSTGKPIHSTAGALYAVEHLGLHGRLLAYLIAGHHAGLPDWQSVESGRGALQQRLQAAEERQRLADALQAEIPASVLAAVKPGSRPPAGGDVAFWLRLLFSCLTDADFLDTEAFMQPEKAAQRGQYPGLQTLWPTLEKHLRQLRNVSTEVNRVRAEVLDTCLEKAALPHGVFSLTVPTGGGKTLSSLAFAMRHALHHGHTRIIYVIPYTSIIEQTAAVFQKVFQNFGEVVVAHHSNLEAAEETPASRLACENWDAPIIVTTSVQFFESLYAARTSRVRKLHNIVNSMVVLDEVQMLPPTFLCPILHAIRQLSDYYHTGFLLCTATQPALKSEKPWCETHLNDITELMPDPQALAHRLRRVRVEDHTKVTHSWETLAEAVQQHDSVLCVVNRRDDCRALYQAVADLNRDQPARTVHLSALMCAAHRSRVIEDIKKCLADGVPLRVISTQLVEAGVDLDFPVVYRALAGLDSIAQAAGRCNREGRLGHAGGLTVVFSPPKPPPRGLLAQAAEIGARLLQKYRQDPLAAANFPAYFAELYWLHGPERLDAYNIAENFKANRDYAFKFRTAAEKFRLIDNYQCPVIVRYGNEALLECLAQEQPDRWLLRELQRYTVNIPPDAHKMLLKKCDIREVHAGVFVQVREDLYSFDTGFLPHDPECIEPEHLVM